MGFIFILKWVLIYSSLIYSKNLVETTDTSSPFSPGSGAGTQVSKPSTDQDGSQATTPPDKKGTGTTGGGDTEEIDIKPDKKTKDGKKAELKDSDYKIHKPKNGKKCNKVKFGDEEVWTHDGGENPYPGMVQYINKKIYIDFKDGTKVFSKGSDGKWKEDTNPSTLKSTTPTSGVTTSNSGTKTGVELCIKNNKKATDQFDHKQDGKVVTYTAKGDYGFKLVKQKNTEIWKAKDESEYANKVVLNGKGKKDKVVTIQLPDGTRKVYNREDKGKPWIEESKPAKQPAKIASTTPTSDSTPVSGGSTQANQASRGSAARTGTQSSHGSTPAT